MGALRGRSSSAARAERGNAYLNQSKSWAPLCWKRRERDNEGEEKKLCKEEEELS